MCVVKNTSDVNAIKNIRCVKLNRNISGVNILHVLGTLEQLLFQLTVK